MKFVNFVWSFLELLFKNFKKLLSFIYRENCLICGCSKEGKLLCKNCLKDVQILSPFAQGVVSGVQIYSACLYEGNIKLLIHKLKFGHIKGTASVLGDILYSYYKKILSSKEDQNTYFKNLQNPLVVPIPTFKTNVLKRGYDNVFEISSCFASLASLEVQNNLLIKIKHTKPQFEMSKKGREANVKGCFGVAAKMAEKYKGRDILIIDDIVTTSATLNEAVLTLKKYGFSNIVCLTVSKAV